MRPLPPPERIASASLVPFSCLQVLSLSSSMAAPAGVLHAASSSSGPHSPDLGAVQVGLYPVRSDLSSAYSEPPTPVMQNGWTPSSEYPISLTIGTKPKRECHEAVQFSTDLSGKVLPWTSRWTNWTHAVFPGATRSAISTYRNCQRDLESTKSR